MASLTPSELAALLGPQAANVCSPSVSVPEDVPRWTQFVDALSRALTARLRTLLRAAVRVTPKGGCPLTAEAVIAVHDPRSVLSVWQSNRSIEPLACVLSPPLVATFVDRLLGGRSAPSGEGAELHRPLTDIDQRLSSRLIDAVRLSVIEQTEPDNSLQLAELPPNTTSFEEAWLPDCPLLRISLELRFVQGGGTLDLLFPIEIADSFEDVPIAADVSRSSLDNPSFDPPTTTVRRSTVVAQLVPTSLKKKDLQSLAVGDVLLTESAPDQSLQVLIDGQIRFCATAGTIAGHKAIRLVSTFGERGN
jgi:flagellar motor switch protein FliM